MNFKSISEFVTHMQRQITTLPEVERQALDRASDVVLEEVRDIPGEYQPGWKRLSPYTIAHKRTGDSPLLETGEMRDSYEKRVVSRRQASIGSDNDKAVTHELGTSRIPPRPVLLTAAARQERVVRAILGRTIVAHLSGRRT